MTESKPTITHPCLVYSARRWCQLENNTGSGRLRFSFPAPRKKKKHGGQGGARPCFVCSRCFTLSSYTRKWVLPVIEPPTDAQRPGSFSKGKVQKQPRSPPCCSQQTLSRRAIRTAGRTRMQGSNTIRSLTMRWRRISFCFFGRG